MPITLSELKTSDLVRETCTQGPDYTFLLTGAATSEFRTFASQLTVGDKTPVRIQHAAPYDDEWQVSWATLVDETTLELLPADFWSSSTGSTIIFTAGVLYATLTFNAGAINGLINRTDTGLTSVGITAPDAFTVTGSPLTTNGNITLDWAAQPPNRVLASPVSGDDGPLTVRALDPLDIPTLTQYSTPASTSTAITEALAPYSPTTAMNSAITAALVPYATTSAVNAALTNYVTLSGVQAVSDKALTGGSINNTPIGATTRAAGYFSSLGVGISSSLLGNIDIRQSANGAVMFYGRRFTDSGGGAGSIARIKDAAGVQDIYRVDTGGNTVQGKLTIQLNTGGDSAQTKALDAGDLTTASNLAGLFHLKQYTTTGGTVNPFLIELKRDNANLAGYSALLVDVTEDVTGTANNFLLNLRRNTVSRFAVRSDGTFYATATDTATNTVVDGLTLTHNSSAAAAGSSVFGEAIRFKGKSSTTSDRDMGRTRAVWVTATDASRESEMIDSVWDVGSEVDVFRRTKTGIQTALDMKVTASAKGLVLTDRTDGTFWRLRVISGVLSIESA